MTEQPAFELHGVAQVPAAAAICFTELKLSQSRLHATEYGRLGIAVKRGFLFERGGRPVVYYHPKMSYMHHTAEFRDSFLREVALAIGDAIDPAHGSRRKLLHYFKSMEKHEDTGIDYQFYEEHEWRIVAGVDPVTERKWKIQDPRSEECPATVREYFRCLPSPEGLRYLLPLDWLGAIIYPSLDVKVRAEKDEEIRDLIRTIAERGKTGSIEKGNLPAELDLDLCRNL